MYAAMLGLGFFCLFGGLRLLQRALAERGCPAPAVFAAAHSPLRALVLGAALTVCLQSSSAVSVLLMGLVGAGVLTGRQALPALLGSNIGTTLTPWLLAAGTGLPGIFRLTFWAPALTALGLLLSLRRSTRTAGTALLAAGAAFAGLVLLMQGMTPLRQGAAFARVWSILGRPLPSFAAAALLTAIVQSSAAVLGLVQALGADGMLSLSAALAAVLGANLGTCSTAFLAAAGQPRPVRDLARAHLRFNLAGAALTALLCLPLRGLALWQSPASPLIVAALHTGFNLLAAVLVWPLRDRLLPRASRMISQTPPAPGCPPAAP